MIKDKANKYYVVANEMYNDNYTRCFTVLYVVHKLHGSEYVKNLIDKDTQEFNDLLDSETKPFYNDVIARYIFLDCTTKSELNDLMKSNEFNKIVIIK